jgi:F-type H+-transporting ATPase subunit delta
VALDGALKEQVLAKAKTLTGSDNVSLENEIDPEIIGGFVLRVGDMQYNASISNQLSTLRKEFSNSI